MLLPDPNIAEEIERRAEEAASADDTDETPETESAASASEMVEVNLGGKVVSVPADAATEIRRAFDTQAGRYGSELEMLRARTYAQPQVVQQYVQPVAAPAANAGFESPNPDLLFQDKKAWDAEFSRRLNAMRAEDRAHAESLVQTSLGLVQQELARRENARAAQEYEDQLFSETLERHPNLQGKESFFFTVMDETYNDIRHLEAPVAYDRVAEIAEQRWASMGGASGAPTPAARPSTPRLLSGGRDRGGSDAAAPARVSISDYITRRQEQFTNNKAVFKPTSR